MVEYGFQLKILKKTKDILNIKKKIVNSDKIYLLN